MTDNTTPAPAVLSVQQQAVRVLTSTAGTSRDAAETFVAGLLHNEVVAIAQLNDQPARADKLRGVLDLIADRKAQEREAAEKAQAEAAVSPQPPVPSP